MLIKLTVRRGMAGGHGSLAGVFCFVRCIVAFTWREGDEAETRGWQWRHSETLSSVAIKFPRRRAPKRSNVT